jgi:hypothetical protein
MVHDSSDVPAGPGSLDSVRIAFDEQRLVSDAGLLLTATLAQRLGLVDLVNESVSLGEVPGAARPGRKVMTLMHGMLAGADRIDQMDVLRAGSTQLIVGHRVMAPRRSGRFRGRFRLVTSASSTMSLTWRSRARGRRAPARGTAR